MDTVVNFACDYLTGPMFLSVGLVNVLTGELWGIGLLVAGAAFSLVNYWKFRNWLRRRRL